MLAGVVGIGLAGCASAAPVVETKTAPRAIVAEQAAEPAAEKEPSDLSLWLRMSTPLRDLPWFASFAPPNNPMRVALQNPQVMLTVMVGEDLAELLDLEQPLDVLFASLEGEGDPRFALALSLRAGADPATLGEAYKPVAKAGGRIAIELSGDLHASACEIRPAARTAARLVCASDATLLAAYAPFLARGAPGTEPAGASVSIRLRAAGLHAMRAEMSKPGKNDDPTEKLGQRWLDRYLRDVGELRAEMSLHDGEIELALEQTLLRGDTVSSAAQCARPGAPEAPPDAFWRLPAEADAAFFFQGAPPEVMRPLAGPALQELVESVPNLTATEQSELLEAMRGLFLTGGPLVIAYGHPRPPAEKALEKLAQKPPKSGPKHDAATEKMLVGTHAALTGWTLVHVDEPVQKWRDGLNAMALAGTGAQAAAPARPGAGPPKLAPPKPATEERRTLEWWSTLSVSPRDGLPPGSFHFLEIVRPNPRYVPKDQAGYAVPHELHIFGAPDGKGTWIAFAESEAAARAQLVQALSGGAAKSLRGRADLAALRGRSGAGAGFLTLGGALSLSLPDGSIEEMIEARDTLLRTRFPRRGAAAIPVWWTSAALGTGRGCRARVSISMGQEALDDAITWLLPHLASP